MTKSNIFRKIAAGVLSLSLLISAVPAIAVESTDIDAAAAEVSLLKDHELELLMKLNIVTEAMSKLKTEEMSRGVFSEMLTAMLGVGGGDNAIEELYNLGIVSGYGNGKLKKNQTITYYEAIKMLICALGYATVAEANGGYPLGYVKAAYDCNLISGSVNNTNLTYDQGMRLILDAGNCNMATVSNDYYLSGIELGGDTMFYTYFDVMRIEGLVSANGFTSLDGMECIPGEVVVGGNAMEVNDTNAAELLGYYVEAYCFDEKIVDKVIVAAPLEKYNKELTILAGSYINATGNRQSMRVDYERENGKIGDIRVEDYRVIYNGKIYGDFNVSDLNTSLADVTFIDNDRDNYYEIVKIDQYETYVVESVNSEKYELYAKYNKSLKLDPDDQDVFIFKSSGGMGEFKDLGAGSVLSVLKSDDGKLVKVYVLGDTAKGTIDGISTANGHKVLTIAGEKYIVSSEYENLVATAPYTKVDPVISAAVNVYLDLKGNIVEMELTSGVWLYGWLLKLNYDADEEEIKTISIYSQTNRKVDLTLGERVTVDGISRKIDELGSVGVLNFSRSTPDVIQQLVRYRENKGKLTQLDTWEVYNEEYEDDDALGATKATDMCEANGTMLSDKVFNQKAGYFFDSTTELDEKIVKDVLLGVGSKTVTFTVPIDADKLKDEFYYSAGTGVGPYGHKNATYEVNAYNINDETKVAGVMVKLANDNRRTNADEKSLLFITELSTVLNQSGEPTTHVKALNLRTGAIYERDATISNPDTAYIPNEFFKTKQFGDIFNGRDLNVAGEGTVLYAASNVFDPDDSYGYTPEGGEYVSMIISAKNRANYNNNVYFADNSECWAEIAWADSSYVRLEAEEDYTIDGITGRESMITGLSGATIYLVDLEAETIEKIDTTRVASYTRDRVDNCKAYAITNEGKLDLMMIYTNLDARN